MNTLTATARVELTAQMMAEAFWAMESSQQVEFFSELARVIREDHKTNTSAYSLGELQWFFVGDELLKTKNAEARDVLMTMAAPLYLNTLRYADGSRA
jgi:hypothetical protein